MKDSYIEESKVYILYIKLTRQSLFSKAFNKTDNHL